MLEKARSLVEGQEPIESQNSEAYFMRFRCRDSPS